MSTASDMLAKYLQAEADLLDHGQSSAFQGRMLSMADLAEIRAGRREWEAKVAQETAIAAGRGGTQWSVARFDE
jgi:hypothetical protein